MLYKKETKLQELLLTKVQLLDLQHINFIGVNYKIMYNNYNSLPYKQKEIYAIHYLLSNFLVQYLICV